MNLMSNARHFKDDGDSKNDLMFEMLPQVKFNMMGQIQQQLKPSIPSSPPSSLSSSSSSSPASNAAIQITPTLLSSSPATSMVDKNKINGQVTTGLLIESSSLRCQSQSTLVSLSFCSESSTAHSSSNKTNNSDSPLDFSTKKQKFENVEGVTKDLISRNIQSYSQQNSSDEPDSPCSRLRSILKMKSPASPVLIEDFSSETVLNLSKESIGGASSILGWNNLRTRSNITNSSSSNSSSPTAMDIQSFLPSPRSATMPTHTSGALHPYAAFSFPNSIVPSLGLPPYAMFSPNLSPIMAQTTPSTTSMPIESPTAAFSHVGVSRSSGSPTHPFSSLSLPPSSSPSGTSMMSNSSMAKSRVTRPFKAYPKDPLTFPSVGLYGLPVVGPTTPGIGVSSESLIYQQSTHAYAEFRKQMLNQSHNSKSRRIGQQKTSHILGPLSDSTTSSTNPLNYGLSGGGGLIESGATSNGSGAEDCLSTSDDGYCGGSQTHLVKTRLNKSDEQLKDEAYWERRRKNNEAAKRSRDARRAKEDEIAIRAAFLEQENLKLRFEVCALKNEMAKLRCMLYKSQ